MSIEGGYEIIARKGMDDWAKLIRSWEELLKEYEAVNNLDVAYWFTEMANCGTIASAAWRSGWTAVCEFQSIRTEDKKESNGRVDLYFGNIVEDYVEAKQTYLDLDKSHEIEALHETKTALAFDQLRSINDTFSAAVGKREGFRNIALHFIVPRWKCDPFEGANVHVERNISATCADLIKSARGLKSHVLAWHFPQSRRTFNSEEGYIYPGIILLAENAAFHPSSRNWTRAST